MRKGYREVWRRLGRVEKTLLALIVIYAVLSITGLSPGWQTITGLAAFIAGVVAAVRWIRILMRHAIWRLRNRLIVAYLFIAVVPIVLILALALLSGYVLVGSVAAYFVRTELVNQERSLLRQAQTLADPRRPGGGRGGGPQNQEAGRGGGDPQRFFRFGGGGGPGARKNAPPTPPAPPARMGEQRAGGVAPSAPGPTPETMAAWLAGRVRRAFPDAEVLISGSEDVRVPPDLKLDQPSREWGAVSGLITREENGGRRLYLWAHASATEGSVREVTILWPMTADRLAGMVPGLGDIELPKYVPASRTSHVAPAANSMDLKVKWVYLVPVAAWSSPNDTSQEAMLVSTRLSTVLGIIFEQKSQMSQSVQSAFFLITALFLLVEIASLWAGIKITRTMTGAVHELYEGTQHVKEGDFAYRIPVKGEDQLAELGSSFNTMTENLGQLIVVAKEKERLQSELEIAREVQNQLFPRDVPSVKTLELKGVCKPARVVSGDYYDFMSLPGAEAAFAIGDVAGKGISAALLMATIQSAMRTQLSANGATPHHYSAARLVAQLNRQLYANTTPEKYATFYFALYDEAKRALTYTNAGHLPPMLVRNGGFTNLNPTGTVVGAFPFAKFEERTVELQDGDILVAYTDGIVEPENPYGEMFGESRLKELVLRYAFADSSEIIARIMEAVVQWTGSSELQDDMTMVVARRI